METMDKQTSMNTNTNAPNTNASNTNVSDAKSDWIARYKALKESLNLAFITNVLDTFKEFNEAIKSDYDKLSKLENIHIDSGIIEHKCFFKAKKVTREIFLLFTILPKLIPELEIEFLETRLVLLYKKREFIMEFSSTCYNGKVSNSITLSTRHMHQSLKCNSLGIVSSVNITKMTAKEFVAKIQELLNTTFTENCHYCGSITY